MGKVIVKNFQEHEFHLPGSTANGPAGGAVGLIVFPRLGTRVGSDGVSVETPGEVEVDSGTIERMKSHVVTSSWLGPDQRGHRQLVVESAPEVVKAENDKSKGDKK